MRINAVFSKKVSTAQYENETYTVTVEAESEFNNVSEIADYLFNQARAAVQRQIDGAATETKPETTIPEHSEPAPEQPQPEAPRATGNGATSITEKQRQMIFNLLDENFPARKDGEAFMRECVGGDRVVKLTRKQASRLIEKLMDRKRQAA
jgi:hypothetical protein